MFKSIRRTYWVIQEFSRRHHKIVTRTITAVVAISLIIAVFIRYVPTPRKHTRIGVVGKYTEESLPLSIRSLVSTGLVSINEDGDPEPALASSWQVSSDGKKYTFQLDDSLRWHGGSRVKGEDLAYNFLDVKVTTSENSITFDLQDPFAPFFHAVARPVLNDGKLGVGEYTLAKSNVYSGILQSVVLVSETTKLTYKFYPTENSAITAFKLGEIDVLSGLSYVPGDLTNDPTIQVSSNSEDSRIAVVFLNNNDTSLLGKSTRQALAYAIKDKSFGHDRATSPIAESSWAHNSLVKRYDYDLERAQSLLEQDFPEPSDLTIELKTMLQYLDQAEIIADNWRANLGIEVSVKVVTSLTNDYQAFLADYAPPKDPDQYTVWHSTQATNFTHFNNLKVDKLLEDGRKTLDKKLRKEIYQDFQRFLLEDSPAIFLFHTSVYDLSHKKAFSK